jgi:putative transposase
VQSKRLDAVKPGNPIDGANGLLSDLIETVVEKAAQARGFDEVHSIPYIDGLRLRISNNGVVGTKIAYLVIRCGCGGLANTL